MRYWHISSEIFDIFIDVAVSVRTHCIAASRFKLYGTLTSLYIFVAVTRTCVIIPHYTLEISHFINLQRDGFLSAPTTLQLIPAVRE